MKTIKIIDLLNKIANGEEVPKKIRYNGILREYSEEDRDYKTQELFEPLYLFFGVLKSGTGAKFLERLNNEVEIIEEKEKEIEKIRNINIDMDGHEIERTPDNYELKEKINELIDAVNELKRGN